MDWKQFNKRTKLNGYKQNWDWLTCIEKKSSVHLNMKVKEMNWVKYIEVNQII